MELTTEPELYVPSIDEFGNYIDRPPSFTSIKYGIRCPCGSRKDKTYDTSTIFSTHTKTKTHQKWLLQLNLNKANYYVENERQKEIIHSQRITIAKFEKEIQSKTMTIDYLTKQLHRMEQAAAAATATATAATPTMNDLLSFD